MKIVCISNDCVDILVELGCKDWIVGLPNESKDKFATNAVAIGGFGTCSLEKINSLKPDIVIGSADIQSAIASKLVKAYHNVLITNQLDIAGIFSAIRMIGGLVGKPAEAESLVSRMSSQIDALRRVRKSPIKVYFEEWNEPYVTATKWISEMVEIAGGSDVFTAIRDRGFYLDREVTNDEIIAANPDVIMLSWCGNHIDTAVIKERKCWDKINAVVHDRIFPIPSEIVLQPGPSIIKGLEMICGILDSVET